MTSGDPKGEEKKMSLALEAGNGKIHLEASE